MKMKEESEKVGLKLNIQKTKIMASCPITSWEIDGETVSDFSFLGSKITADGDCSHAIKRRLKLKDTPVDLPHPHLGRWPAEMPQEYLLAGSRALWPGSWGAETGGRYSRSSSDVHPWTLLLSCPLP